MSESELQIDRERTEQIQAELGRSDRETVELIRRFVP